jgi:hypothetical protein
MNDQQERLLKIANDLLQWNLDMLAFAQRVGKAEARREIPDDEKQELREAAIKLSSLCTKVAELSDSQPTAPELSSIDRQP